MLCPLSLSSGMGEAYGFVAPRTDLKATEPRKKSWRFQVVFHLFCCDVVERTLDSESGKCKKVLFLIILLRLNFSSDPKENR